MSSTLSTALQNVELLESGVADEAQPNIAPPPQTLVFEPSGNNDLTEVAAFGVEQLAREANMISRLNRDARTAREYAGLIYACRSKSKAIPQAKSDQKNKMELYEKSYTVLKPEVDKMKSFMRFQTAAIEKFAQVVEYVVALHKKEKDPVVSDALMNAMVSLLDSLITVDNIKNMKTAWNNDFAHYKRTCQNLKRLDVQEETENQFLYLFLANNNSIAMNIRDHMRGTKGPPTACDGVDGFSEALTTLINFCVDMLENDSAVVPNEKYSLLRAMAFGVQLVDGPDERSSVLKNKRLRLDRVQKMVKTYPIIPLMGDMQIPLAALVKGASHIDLSKWELSPDNDEEFKAAQRYCIINHIESLRADYKRFSARLAIFINKAKRFKTWDISATYPLNSVLFQGIKMVGNLSARLREQSAWKYAHPTDKFVNKDCPDDATEYEKLVRYNYTLEEKLAVIELIGMIKGLSAQLYSLDTLVAIHVRRGIHRQLTLFLTNTVEELIQVTAKKKKSSSKTLMLIKQRGLDVAAVVSTGNDDQSGKKKAAAGFMGPVTLRNVKARACGASWSQLFVLRSLVQQLSDERSASMKGGALKSRDFSSQQVDALRDFFDTSATWPYLLDFASTVRQSADLSELWLREFYLEITKAIQFPIEQSLPWILTSTVLDHPHLTDYLLMPLDLYNDAGSMALNSLDSRFLFDEIEAEVNLCFDELMFKISQDVFAHYKVRASSVLLEESYKRRLTSDVASHRYEPGRARYDSLLQQRHFQLLGRAVSIPELLSERFNRMLRASVDHAIARFEARDITSIMELEGLLQQCELTHSFLREHLPHMDDFETIVREVDEAPSFATNNGRVMNHVLSELVWDFLPNYAYNSGTDHFVRPTISVPLGPDVPREPMPKPNPILLCGNRAMSQAWSALFESYKDTVGAPQVSALVRVIGSNNVSTLIEELIKNLEIQLKSIIQPYIESLQRGLPVEMKLPIHGYGTTGTFSYYVAKLEPLLQYTELRSEVFHALREMGNSLIFTQMIEQVMVAEDIFNNVQATPFYHFGGVGSNKMDMFFPSDHNVRLQTPTTAFSNVVNRLSQGTPSVEPLLDRAQRASVIHAPYRQRGSLFLTLLRRLDRFLDDIRDVWLGAYPVNGVMTIDETAEFHRLWSALLFVYNMPTVGGSSAGEAVNMQSCKAVFGEGLPWVGATILYLLGQRRGFELLDYSSRVLSVFGIDHKVESAGGIDVGQFLRQASDTKTLNTSIFATLRLTMPERDSANGLIGRAHPPSEPGEVGMYVPYKGEFGTAEQKAVSKIEAGAGSGTRV